MKLDIIPEARQMRRVCETSARPMARGCCSRVNKKEAVISARERRSSSDISESSLIKILVLGAGDGAVVFFLTL